MFNKNAFMRSVAAALAIQSILFLGSVAAAAEKKGVTLADHVTEQKHELLLNGLGVRKAYGVVSVYVGGLYLEKKSKNADEIIASKDWKKITLKFIMDVEKEKITDAWSDGMKKNCASAILKGSEVDCNAYDKEMKQLNGWMANMKNKEEITFLFGPDVMTVTVNGIEKGTIAKAGFPQRILSIFIGEFPPNKALKDGMLGLD